MSPRLSILRAFITSLLSILWTFLIACLGMVSFLFSPRGHLCLVLAQVWARGIFWIGGIQVHRQLDLELDPQKSYLYLPNHESLLDIPALFATLPQKIVMVAKRSIQLVPIFSWVMTLSGFIFINRKNRASAFRSIEKAGHQLNKGRSVVIFPEGTVGNGQALLPFKWGAFILAQETGFPVVPIAIFGTYARLPPDHFCIFSGSLAVRIGSPMLPPAKGEPLEPFKNQVRTEIERLKEEARMLVIRQKSI